MNLEFKTFIYSMFNNLIISIIKIIGGILFNLGSLFADGFQTLSDFVTDIVCLIGSVLSNKKPTKTHPFGFGKIEYLSNIYVGMFLFLIGIFILFTSFNKKYEVPDLKLLYLLLFVFILKFIAVVIMSIVGKKLHSNLLITSVKESKTDLYSTITVMIITILLQYEDKISILKYSDIVGTIIIGIIIIKTSLSIIVTNSLSIIGEVEENIEIEEKINKILSKYDNVKNHNSKLIKYGSYYKLELELDFIKNTSLINISLIEKKIKSSILRNKRLNIRYVTIFIIDKAK